MPSGLDRRYLAAIRLKRAEVPSFEAYPFSLPVIRRLRRLEFHPSVTFLVGENGIGKSTLIEGIAVKMGFNPEGGSKNFKFETKATHSDLHQYFVAERGVVYPKDGYFLRAESFYKLSTVIENLGVVDSYGGHSLHKQSHGESFFNLILHRFKGKGIYILDEPEAALSPNRQMSMLTLMHRLVKLDSQFIIATHSPILMAYPDATIYLISDKKVRKVSYEETEHYKATRDFLNKYEKMLGILLEEDIQTT